MILDESTQVYLSYKNNTIPQFGVRFNTEEVNISVTTLGEISARINAKVLDVQEVIISTDFDVLLDHFKKENLKVKIKEAVDEMQLECLESLAAYVEHDVRVPWQSFNRY